MTVKKYITGYALSVVLTFAAFGAVFYYLGQGGGLSALVVLLLLVAFAVAQLFVQLVYFLHLGEEKKPYFNLMTLAFAAFVVVVLVGGSIWIMYHLKHNMAGHEEMLDV